MGSWGVHSLESDTARDWLAAAAPRGAAGLAAALGAVLDADDLDVGVAECGLAAAEVVAALCGHPIDAEAMRLSGRFEVDEAAAEALRGDAVYAILRATGEASDLRRLWLDEGPDAYDAWIAALTDLRARLSRPVAPAPSVAEVAPDLIGELVLEVKGLRADVAVLRQELADGLRQVRRDVLGARP
jgi:hypothetical protein